MKQVRCISPHGGARNGMRHNGEAVHCLPDGSLPVIDPAALRLPAAAGGYISDARIPGGFAEVGKTYDVADDFQADGFHWEDAAAAPAPQPEPPETEGD